MSAADIKNKISSWWLEHFLNDCKEIFNNLTEDVNLRIYIVKLGMRLSKTLQSMSCIGVNYDTDICRQIRLSSNLTLWLMQINKF